MRHNKFFAFILAASLISPVMAAKDQNKANKGKSEAKQSEVQLQNQQRTTERAESMQQRRENCETKSEKAECAGLQKGRNKDKSE